MELAVLQIGDKFPGHCVVYILNDETASIKGIINEGFLECKVTMEKFDLNNGHLGLSSVETLYNYLQRVYIKSKKGEEKTRVLRIALEVKSGLAVSVGKVLSLQITDENDCTFFYSLLLTQEDFSVLKNQQGLLVDFDHFPAQLIKLLETCRSQEFNKFILVLDENDVITPTATPTKGFVFLKVIETNNFKNLCHLSLKVVQGTDEDIKNHMALKINYLTERLAEEEKRSKLAEGNLADALKALDAKTTELTEFRVKLTEEKNNLRLEMSRQVSEEREKLTRLQMEWQQKMEIEKTLLGKQYQKQIADMNDQINSLTFNNKNLYEAKCQLETAVKERNFHVEALEKQVLQLTQEVNLLRKQKSQLDQEYHETDKAVVGLKTKLAVVEQELKDKGKFVEKQQELLKVANEQKTFLEEALNEKEAALQRKQTTIHNLSADLMKSNEIIARLQTDLAANKAKMKLRTDIALEQEKILEKKSHQIVAQSETIKDLENRLAKSMEEYNSIKNQLEEANRKLEEKDVIIKKNENVINWLNRRLTESTSGAPGSNLLTSRSDSAFGAPQPKGSISNLTKGWPPWLVNSVNGSNSSQGDSIATSNSTNGFLKISSSSPVDIIRECKRNQDENQQNKESKDETKTNADQKMRGLDPKYFQTSIDKDYIINPQIIKPLPKSSTKSTSGNVRQGTSAYFPTKSVLNNNC